MSGIICCVCSILAISGLQLFSRNVKKERHKIQVKKESQRSRGQWWVLLQGLPQFCHLRRQKARGTKAMEIRVFGVRKLKKMIERGNPLSTVTCPQHATQDWMMTKLGLLKSGKLVNRWMIKRSNPLYTRVPIKFLSWQDPARYCGWGRTSW